MLVQLQSYTLTGFQGDVTQHTLWRNPIAQLSWYPHNICCALQYGVRPVTISGTQLVSAEVRKSILQQLLSVINHRFSGQVAVDRINVRICKAKPAVDGKKSLQQYPWSCGTHIYKITCELNGAQIPDYLIMFRACRAVQQETTFDFTLHCSSQQNPNNKSAKEPSALLSRSRAL